MTNLEEKLKALRTVCGYDFVLCYESTRSDYSFAIVKIPADICPLKFVIHAASVGFKFIKFFADEIKFELGLCELDKVRATGEIVRDDGHEIDVPIGIAFKHYFKNN